MGSTTKSDERKAYYEKHKEEERAYAKAYYAAHAEERRAYNAMRRERDSEALHARAAQYRSANSQKERARKKAWSSANAEHLAAYEKSYKDKRAIVRMRSLERYPEKRVARLLVSRAIRSKRIPPARTLKCACGAQASEYHHHLGYAPEHYLDVIPVCKKCHVEAHYGAV